MIFCCIHRSEFFSAIIEEVPPAEDWNKNGQPDNMQRLRDLGKPSPKREVSIIIPSASRHSEQIVGTKEPKPSRHNRVGTHKNSKTVTACTGLP